MYLHIQKISVIVLFNTAKGINSIQGVCSESTMGILENIMVQFWVTLNTACQSFSQGPFTHRRVA